MPDWQLFLSEVLNVDWWWWRLFPADIRQAVTQQLLAETRVSWRVCAHDKSMRKAFFSDKMESSVRWQRARII